MISKSFVSSQWVNPIGFRLQFLDFQLILFQMDGHTELEPRKNQHTNMRSDVSNA